MSTPISEDFIDYKWWRLLPARGFCSDTSGQSASADASGLLVVIGVLQSSRGLSRGDDREVDIGTGDLIDIVGQRVERDMENDLQNLGIAVASGANRL